MGLRLARPLRNSDGPLLLESLLVAAVVGFLAVRSLLTVTGFPQVGGGELHVAHMLWGGALMLVGLLVLLAYLDRPVHHFAAIVAGLGFGVFVDEIGKFLTADNDYFFRPAIALIYVTFVAVFLAARALAGRRRMSEREALANAFDLLEGSIGSSLEPGERARISELLDLAAGEGEVVGALRRYLATIPARREEDEPWESIPRWIARLYARVARDPRFGAVLTAAFVLYAGAALVASLVVLAGTELEAPLTTVELAALGQAISTVIGAALIARGVLALPDSRVDAYRWFLRGLLVWILISQVFVFYRSQLAGLGGLTVDLAAYAMLRYALRLEESTQPTRSPR